MGWTTYYRAPGQTDREHFQEELRDDLKIIDSTTIKNVFYAACKDEKTGEVFALVYLIHRTRGYYNFGVKAMDETVGPCEHECPDRILDLLTPTDSKWANEWRETCRRVNAAKAEARAKNTKVKDGSTIRLALPLNFQNGMQAREFKLHVNGRRRAWTANPGTSGQFICRLPRDWATRYSWERIAA